VAQRGGHIAAGAIPPMTDPRPSFIATMLGWLNGRMAPPGVTIDAETPLFRTGLISSIRILDLIAWTERATGRSIPDREIRMDNFQTVARIADVFARSSPVAEPGGDA
jgi:acyl carrier protein